MTMIKRDARYWKLYEGADHCIHHCERSEPIGCCYTPSPRRCEWNEAI